MATVTAHEARPPAPSSAGTAPPDRPTSSVGHVTGPARGDDKAKGPTACVGPFATSRLSVRSDDRAVELSSIV